MSSPHGGEATRTPPDTWQGPFGIAGFRLNMHAKLLIDDLGRGDPYGEVPLTGDGLPTWNDWDWLAFSDYLDFHHELDRVEPNDGIEAVLREVDLFHTCLPLSEGERRWLLDMAESTKSHPVRLEQIIVSVETTITSSGLHQMVLGRDLVRRWAAWRRQIDEFETQGEQDVLGKAQQHLREISRLLEGSTLDIPDIKP